MPVASEKRAPERKFYESPVPANDNEPESRAASGENNRRYDGNASGPRVYAYVGNDPINATDPSGMDGDSDDGDSTPTINVVDNYEPSPVGGINGLTSGGSGSGKNYYTGSRIGLTNGQSPGDALQCMGMCHGYSYTQARQATVQSAPTLYALAILLQLLNPLEDASLAAEAANLATDGIAGGEQSALAAPALANQLSVESASSAFAADGTLSEGALASAREIIPSSEISNPAIPDGFSKFTSPVFQSPSGDFQVHFYMDPITFEPFYGLDYKTIFIKGVGGK